MIIVPQYNQPRSLEVIEDLDDKRSSPRLQLTVAIPPLVYPQARPKFIELSSISLALTNVSHSCVPSR